MGFKLIILSPWNAPPQTCTAHFSNLCSCYFLPITNPKAASSSLLTHCPILFSSSRALTTWCYIISLRHCWFHRAAVLSVISHSLNELLSFIVTSSKSLHFMSGPFLLTLSPTNSHTHTFIKLFTMLSEYYNFVHLFSICCNRVLMRELLQRGFCKNLQWVFLRRGDDR